MSANKLIVFVFLILVPAFLPVCRHAGINAGIIELHRDLCYYDLVSVYPDHKLSLTKLLLRRPMAKGTPGYL